MSRTAFSRRDILKGLSGALLAGSPGLTSRAAFSITAENPGDDSLVDTHVHLVRSRVPGELDAPIPIAPFGKTDIEGPKQLAKTFMEEIRKAGVAHALCMPRLEVSDSDPLVSI